ncbi:unnamed protein product [Heligmosomoides polygyrus]|uniref:Uncharacterized protein n=1 Tax=Heligmosomoides polygyrus TaxID=6339 RepID=A0A183FNP1_HELPZ|nr:unnamed protein product [Heligmosomoides polygyrus]
MSLLSCLTRVKLMAPGKSSALKTQNEFSIAFAEWSTSKVEPPYEGRTANNVSRHTETSDMKNRTRDLIAFGTINKNPKEDLIHWHLLTRVKQKARVELLVNTRKRCDICMLS